MKKASIASLLALLLSAPAAALAAVPQTLAFSARIADNGSPVTGSHTVKFTLWDCDGSSPATCVDPTNVLWSETQTLTATDGVVTTALGADLGTPTPNPLPASIFAASPLFLEVTLDGTAFSPRLRIHSVPYAIRAGSADLTAAARSSPQSFGSFTTTDVTLASLAVTIPAEGVVMVSGQASFNNSTAANWLNCNLREDGTSFLFYYWDGGDVDGWYDQAQYRSQVKAVSPGAHTYSLACNSSNGSVSYTQAQVHVVYFPAGL
jgi:hypothetical protein